MFYYLILNSSILKKKKEKDKIVLTLIGGSLIYLVTHAFLSFSFKKDIVMYLWVLFLIDISAVFISSDFNGFSSLQVSNNSNTEDKRLELDVVTTLHNTKFNSDTSNLNQGQGQGQGLGKEEEKTTNSQKNKSSIKKTKKKILKTTKQGQDTNSNKPDLHKKKQVKFEESTPIKELDSSKEETYNLEEAQNINLTLESLENLNLDLNYPDENLTESNLNKDTFEIPNNSKKKMEDDYSDIGSELDLEQFENSIANSQE